MEWFKYHRLPTQETIAFDHDISVQLKFVRESLVSNTCSIVVFVEDKGNAFEVDAKVLKNDGWMSHVANTVTTSSGSSIDGVQARSLQFHDSESSISSDRSSDFERWSELPSLQKLRGALDVTIEVEYRLQPSTQLQRRFKTVMFPSSDFGILNFFVYTTTVDPVQQQQQVQSQQLTDHAVYNIQETLQGYHLS